MGVAEVYRACLLLRLLLLLPLLALQAVAAKTS
jgi:hypothetical protein